MSTLRAPGFPEAAVKARARAGAAAVLPDRGEYGSVLLGADPYSPASSDDVLDALQTGPAGLCARTA